MGRGALGLNAELDIRHLLASVDLPTLVMHRTNEQWVDVGNSRYLAAHIAGAQLVEMAGVDHRPWLGDADEILDAWVVGDQPCVVIDWQGVADYAKRS
jgi:pimeloyl-ACP methyl ester carboxylesterase